MWQRLVVLERDSNIITIWIYVSISWRYLEEEDVIGGGSLTVFVWQLWYTANEGLVRFQYKWLVPIYVFLEMKQLFPKKNYNVPSPSSYTCICERFINLQNQSAYSAAGKYVDQSWQYINFSQTHECGNWDWGRTISRKGMLKWDFSCSVQCYFTLRTPQSIRGSTYISHSFRVKRTVTITELAESSELGLPHSFSRRRVCPPSPHPLVCGGGGRAH